MLKVIEKGCKNKKKINSGENSIGEKCPLIITEQAQVATRYHGHNLTNNSKGLTNVLARNHKIRKY